MMESENFKNGPIRGEEVIVNRESIKDMGQRIYSDLSGLVSKEGQLIKAELNEKASDVKEASVSGVSGGAILYVGLISLAATATLMLGLITELWVASAIVTIAFIVVGGMLVLSAKNKFQSDNLKPKRSIEAFGEIAGTFKEKMNEITRH